MRRNGGELMAILALNPLSLFFAAIISRRRHLIMLRTTGAAEAVSPCPNAQGLFQQRAAEAVVQTEHQVARRGWPANVGHARPLTDDAYCREGVSIKGNT